MRIEHWIYELPLRFRSLFLRRRVEQDLDDEIQYHLERQTEQYIAQGLTPAQARQAALRAMDGITQHKEECRHMRRIDAIDNTVRDLRYSLRVLAKSPGFTFVAVFTLALAIGANAVVFGVLDALILRPLNVPRQDSLYLIERGQNGYQSYPDYLDERDRNRSFEALAAFNINQVGIDTGDRPSAAWVYETSGNYFEVMGIRPQLGRFYQASGEHGVPSAPFIVLSHSYWHNSFSEDPGVVGRVVRLNKHPFTILGIAPPEFHGTFLGFSPDFYMPLVNHDQVQGTNELNTRARHLVFAVLGHLKPGVTPAQATADLTSIGSWMQTTYPKDEPQWAFRLARPALYGNFIGGPVRAFVTALMVLSALILLAACANLGSLFAARAADRGREVALRLALGATRQRILRQLFTESAVISLVGGAAGLLGSLVLLRQLSQWQPFSRFPIRVPVNPDASVYGIALLLAIVSAILFGIVPLRQVLKTDPYQVVKAGATATFGRRITVRDCLLVVQVAICAVLVTSSMVAVRGLVRSLHSNFGFEPRNAMLVKTVLSMAGYSGDRVPAMQKRMIDAMASIPGVASVGLASQTPLAMDGPTSTVYTDDTTDLRPSTAAGTPFTFSVSPEYFTAAGTTLLAGRNITWHDELNAPRVAVVNREFARRIFASDALGRYFKRRGGERIQVVGIVEDGKYFNLAETQKPAIFLSILQSPSSDSWLVLRSAGDPQQLADDVRATLRGLDSGLPSFIENWEQALSSALFPSRMATLSLGVLGMMGGMLSITGIFGMAAYSVSKRLRELGIRIALGAQPAEVLQAALGRALKLLALGSAAGLLLGILATPVLASIVYQATPRDPLVLSGVVLAMVFLGLLAAWIPAQRALSLDPLKLLREE